MKTSMLHCLTLAAALGFGVLNPPQAGAQTTLITTNTSWRYLSDGSDQGTAWRAVSFNDLAWSNGVALFGFETTPAVYPWPFRTPTPGATNRITYYFRTHFTWVGDTAGAVLTTSNYLDDGAVYYLNGVEAARLRVSNNPVLFGDFAQNQAAEGTLEILPLAASSLVTGDNVLAVEVHQSSAASSDLVFGLTLGGTVVAAPTAVLTSPASGASFLVGDNAVVTATAQDAAGVAFVDFFDNGVLRFHDTTAPFSITEGDLTAGTHTLLAISRGNGGVNVTSAPVTITVTNEPGVAYLIANGSVWKYLDNGSDPGTAWRAPEFDDSAWNSGPAELGFGDSGDNPPRPERTVINGGPATNRIVTTYFRHKFTVLNPDAYSNLIVRLLRDDGGVVYLNGVEVFRSNIDPTNPIVFTTLAFNAVDDGTAFFSSTNLSPALLVAGQNVLAVETHQGSLTSSDLSFDAMVLAQGAGIFPPSCVRPPKDMVLWLPLDEPSGPTALNTPGGNNGTHMGGVNVGVAGKVGKAVVPVGGFVQVPNYPAIEFSTGDFSFDAWIKPGSGTVLSKYDPVTKRGYAVWVSIVVGPSSTYVLGAQLSDGFGTFAGVLGYLQPGVWSHVAVIVERGVPNGVIAYINGQPGGFSGTAPTGSYASSSPVWLGNGQFGSFNGAIDEVELFNRALTQAEAQSIYGAGQQGKCKHYCSIPWDSPFCLGANAINVTAFICNSTTQPQTYNYWFQGLPVGPMCSIPGPTVFTPNVPTTPTITVPAGKCLPVSVTIGRPSAMNTSGQVGCYDMFIQPVSGTEIYSCRGSVQDSGKACLNFPNDDNTATNLSRMNLGPVTVTNTSGANWTLRYQVVVMTPEMTMDDADVSLNGLPPGTAVTNSITLAPGQGTAIDLTAQFVRYQPGRFYTILIQADTDGDGLMEPLVSASLRNFVPPAGGIPGNPECILSPANMVLWLPFDETNGTTAQNLAGGNHGTLFNGPAHNPGSYVSNSLCFDGVDDDVEVASYPALGFGTGDFSMDAWVKVDPAGSLRSIVSHRQVSGNTVIGYVFLLWSDNTLAFQLGDGAGWENFTTTLEVPADGQWHFVAVTVDRVPNGITFYMDALPPQQADPTRYPGSVTPPANNPLTVGAAFNGCIDELELFNRALTGEEIAALYHAGAAGKCKINPPGAPPVITMQPRSVTAPLGQPVAFAVTAVGGAPLSYQWFFNGTALPGATLANLNLGPAEPQDAGNYTVEVSNPFGVVTSAAATLTLGGNAPINQFHVWVRDAASMPAVLNEIVARGGVISEESLYFLRFSFTSTPAAFAQIAALPAVVLAQPEYERGLFNYNSRFAINTIKVQAAPYGLGVPGLTGAGVVAGVWDGGTFGLTHLDYSSRLTVMENCTPYSPFDTHAAHVIGTMAGNGAWFNNAIAGMAPAATIKDWSFLFCPGVTAAPTPQTEVLNARILPPGWPAPQIDLSQNSWGFVPNVCTLYGSYLGDCADYDKLVRQQALPIFFAAGNSQAGLDSSGAACFVAGFGGFGTVLPMGTAKNVVTVGAINVLDVLTTFSGCGPTADGRLKPDLMAFGENVYSTTDPPWQGMSYFPLSGTSMATPAVSGTAALLMEQFANLSLPSPSPALLKAIFCNTATDLGNVGPDFKYGYGKVNAEKAVDTIVNNDFADVTSGGLVTGGVWTRPISVPQGCELRVTLAWSDMEYLGPNPLGMTLINDLDLELVDPSSGIKLPLTLNPSTPGAPASPGVNRRDNVEQVVIPAAQGGAWTIVVNGFNVPAGPQNFAVAWCVVCKPACKPQPIPGLWNTGFDLSGLPLPVGAIDPHYVLIPPLPPLPAFTDARRNYYGPPWVPDGPNSFWLQPGPASFTPNGTYIYELTFDLGNCDPSTASITGRWAADDWAELRINNVKVPGVNAAYAFAGWAPLIITSGFVSGPNTIQFVVQNLGGSPSGLRVELSGTACCSGCATPPSGLVGWWPLDELPTAVTYAEMVYGTATTIQSGPLGPPFANGPLAVPGQVAGGSFFRSGFNYGQANNSPWLNFGPATGNGNGSFSVDCWVMLTSGFANSTFHTIVDKLQTTLTGYAFGVNNFGQLELRIGDGTLYTRTSTLNLLPNVWTFVGVTVDRSTPSATVTFYVNGASVTAPTIPTLPIAFAGSTLNSLDLFIGGSGVPGTPEEISLDEVELFNRVLSAPAMNALWAAGSGGKCKPCLPMPANDECLAAQSLTVNGGYVCGTTLCATPSTPPGGFNPVPCGNSLMADDVWYSVTALCNGSITVDTCQPCPAQPGMDTVLSAYLNNCNMLTQVSPTACDDNSCGPTLLNSQITFPVTAGMTYRVRVANGAGSPSGGWFAIQAVQIPPPPILVCALPKTQQCGPPIFDPPVLANDVCCGGNLVPAVLNTTPLAGPPCSQTSTRTWFVTDCNGNTVTCQQTVTIADTTPPVITSCPANFSVNAPAAWSFGTPTATDNCGPATILNPPTTTVVVDGVNCRLLHTRTWQAQDACGNLSLPCNQTVTVNYLTPPPNDLCANAQTLPVNGVYICGTTLCATATPAGNFDPNPPTSPLCGNSLLSRDVWYKVVAKCSGQMTVDTCQPCPLGPGFDTVVSAYGNNCNQLIQVSAGACNDNFCGSSGAGPQSQITFPVLAGQTYLVRVAGANGPSAAGWFSIRAVQTMTAPPNDLVTAAIPLTVNAPYVCGYNYCATPTPANQFNPTPPTSPPCGFSLGSVDVWYKVVAACNGLMTVDTCLACPGFPAFDTVVSAYFNNPFLLTQVSAGACNDDTFACGNGFQSVITFPVVAGQTYLLRVAGFGSPFTVGWFSIRATQTPGAPPPNDDCANAILVTGVTPANPFTTCGTTLCATPSAISPASGGIPAPCGNSAFAPDVWYKFKPQCSGSFRIDTCGNCAGTITPFNTVVSVYSDPVGLGCGVLTPVGCNDNAPPFPSFPGPWCSPQSLLTFSGTAGVTYYVRVAGNGIAAGNFQLNITQLSSPPPLNDLCANATVVLPGTYPWYNCNANTDGPLTGGCPGVPRQDVWFSYTSTCAGLVSLSTCQSGIDTVLAVYSGLCNTPGFTPINCNDDATAGPCAGPQSYLTFNAAANTPYTIRVGSRLAGVTGGGLLTILGPNPPATQCPPAVGQSLCRWFQVKGAPNNTPWAWSITAPCSCANICVQNVPGVPATGNANTLAQAFVNSINAACPGGGLTAQAFNIPNFPGVFSVCVTCPSLTQWQLAVGPANTPCANLCVVPFVTMVTPLPVTGPCNFNPDIVGLPTTGIDANNNGIDDGIDILAGVSADVNSNFLPDETEACLGPQLALNPESQVVQLGDNVLLTVAASGTAPFTYRWMRDGSPLNVGGNITGANSNALSITAVTDTDLGAYTVAISNACDGTLSAPADVTLVAVVVPVLYDLQLSSDGFRFTVDTKAGFDYVAEYKNDLSEVSWIRLAIVLGTGGPEVFHDPERSVQTRFYRVRRQSGP